MVLPRAFDEGGDEACVVFRVELPVADPSRRAPLQRLNQNPRIALARFFHQPPLVTALEVLGLRVVELLASAGMAGLRAIRRINVATNLDFQMMQTGAEVWLEKVIQYLRALRLRVVVEQSRGSTGTQCSHPRPDPALRPAIDRHGELAGLCRTRSNCQGPKQRKYLSACHLNSSRQSVRVRFVPESCPWSGQQILLHTTRAYLVRRRPVERSPTCRRCKAIVIHTSTLAHSPLASDVSETNRTKRQRCRTRPQQRARRRDSSNPGVRRGTGSFDHICGCAEV